MYGAFKKPLFDPPPPTTLDHYFAKPGTSNSRSASSSQVQKRVKACQLSPQTRQRTTLKRVQPFGTEIIVIDSDEGDDEAPVASTKRKAEGDHAGGSSDVEVVDAISHRSHDDTLRSGKKTRVESGSKPFDMDTDDLLALAQDDALHFSEFGKPQLLVPTEDEENAPTFAEDQSLQPARVDQRPVAVIVDPDDLQPPLLETQSDSSSVLPSCPTQACPSGIIEIDDEWGTGDDELFQANGAEVDGVLELADEDEIEEVLKLEDAPPDTPGDNLDQCPFCGINLTSFSSLVCSLLLCAIIVSPHTLRTRTCNHTLLPAATRFPPQVLR